MKFFEPIFVRWRVLGLGVLIAALSAGIGGPWVRERSRIAGLEQARGHGGPATGPRPRTTRPTG